MLQTTYSTCTYWHRSLRVYSMPLNQLYALYYGSYNIIVLKHYFGLTMG